MFGLMEAFIRKDEGGGESEENLGSEAEEKVRVDKGKGVETKMRSKEEKEEKMEDKSGVKWEAGSLFETPGPSKE